MAQTTQVIMALKTWDGNVGTDAADSLAAKIATATSGKTINALGITTYGQYWVAVVVYT